MSEGKGQSLESSRYTSTSAYTVLEVGGHKHGLHCRPAQHSPETWFHLGYCRQAHQDDTLHSSTHHLQYQEICGNLYWTHYLPTWDTQNDNFRSRCSIWSMLLGAIARIQWNHHSEDEATWETESYLNQHFRGFLPAHLSTHIFLRTFPWRNLRTRLFLRG